jgi:GNAT superfamily N-acetyltransferase
MRLLVDYLELLRAPIGHPLSAPVYGAEVKRECWSIDSYLELYRAVGTPVRWDQRLRLSPDELLRLLQSSNFLLFIHRIDGRAAGLCEFASAQIDADVELVHFGLIPAAQGHGCGAFLLDRALRAVWDRQPSRVWLHTDTNDHPKAKPLYLRFGFRPFDQKVEDFDD